MTCTYWGLNMQGFIASGVAFAVQIWCIDRGGPVFVAVYQPVQTLVVAIMASLTLGEKFYLGGYLLNLLHIKKKYRMFVTWKQKSKTGNHLPTVSFFFCW